MLLKNHIDALNKNELVRALSESDYPFALWRLPDQEEVNFIVSLSGVKDYQDELTQLENGFVINSFNSYSESLKAQYIKADLILNQSLEVDPRVSSQQLDKFNHFLRNQPPKTSSVSEEQSYESIDSPTFLRSVEKAISEINRGSFEKVVLSRYKDVPLSGFDAFSFFEKLCAKYPRTFCSLVHLPNKGLWIGASPELLVSKNTNAFKTIALAGTKKIEPGQHLQEIAWTQKEIEEQAFVSRYIINCFKKLRLREFHEHGPKTIQAGNLVHLKTEFQVDFNEITFDGLADQMVRLLHPTSAVCGMPLHPAMSFIQANEGFDRGYFAGFLGPVNSQDSTNLFVNLRCMNVQKGKARLFAGAGITQDSNPEKEFLETEIKMQTLLSVIDG